MYTDPYLLYSLLARLSARGYELVHNTANNTGEILKNWDEIVIDQIPMDEVYQRALNFINQLEKQKEQVYLNKIGTIATKYNGSFNSRK